MVGTALLATLQAVPQFDGSQKLSAVVADAEVVTSVVAVPLQAVIVSHDVVVLLDTVLELSSGKKEVITMTLSVHDVNVLVVQVSVPVDVGVDVGSCDGYVGSPLGPIVIGGQGMGKPAGGLHVIRFR